VPPDPEQQREQLPEQQQQRQQQQQLLQAQQQASSQVQANLQMGPDLRSQPPLPTGEPTLNNAFVQALRSDSLTQAKQLLQQRADVNFVENAPAKRTPLLHVLESGGNVDAVNLLLRSRANVNIAGALGKTPLHLALEQYNMNLPPLVALMLIHYKADLTLPNSRGVTPLDTLRVISMQPGQQGPRQRQLLNEVSEMSTTDIYVIEGQRIQSALFADTIRDKVVFSTESSIGIYSLVQKRVMFFKKLKNQHVSSAVKQISVNPELGTIAVCLELLDMQNKEIVGKSNVFIVWPNGQLQDEEPLKLSIKVDAMSANGTLPACVMLSRCQGQQMLLGRSVGGKVFCWHLNQARSQLVSETELTQNGGLMALADTGTWVAVVTSDGESGMPQEVSVFLNAAAAGAKAQMEVVAKLPKLPHEMAIQQTTGSSSTCFLAIAEGVQPDGTPSPIEVFSVSADGAYSSVYRLKAPSLCYTLIFCHGISTYLLSGHVDGLIVVYDLVSGGTSMCHDSPTSRFLSICADRSLVVSAEENYFRVFKVPAPELA